MLNEFNFDPADRAPFSPISKRPQLRWPNDAKIAIWVVPNVEHYEFLPRPSKKRDPWPRMKHPDIIGYGTRDYGNRVGIWRMFDLFDRFEIRATVSLSMANWVHYPEIFKAMEARNWSIMCHGMYNTRYHWDMSEHEERAEIEEAVTLYGELTGKTLSGWFSPAASYTLNTPDLIAEAKITYYCDWHHDDQPLPLRVRTGSLITIPYSMDYNDSILHRQQFEALDYYTFAKDAFDTLYDEGGQVLCLALHPYMMGQPHRIGHLARLLEYIKEHDKVWIATGDEIADWYLRNCADHIAWHKAREAS
ncbi:polysaccharide deacetylase family protein [Roseobacter sp. HKCCA0882]|uniref:polysaccharide deacetylase family protein n=1 Tax=Roseobacter sp. HKCCA0882 TaxID=3120337 RepID=UPI0030EB9B2E